MFLAMINREELLKEHIISHVAMVKEATTTIV